MGLPGGRKDFKSEKNLFQQNLSLKAHYHGVFGFFIY